MATMNTVTLKPATKRLKQLVKEFGDQWRVVRSQDTVQCLNGPGVFVESMCGRHTRWVDKDQLEGMK
jgi:hypothetical protein